MYLNSLFVAATAALAVSANHQGLSRVHRNLRDSVLHKRSLTFERIESMEGQSFFDHYNFFKGPDPTNGFVDYLSSQDASNAGLAYVQTDNTTIMKIDDTTWLGEGQNRNSVRITSNNAYGGLVLIVGDFYAMPHGCSVWPAFWLVGPNWPNGGEVDIIEGINEQTSNQVTVHTGQGCTIDRNYSGALNPDGVIQNATGQPLGDECTSDPSANAGCAVEGSPTSYGHPYNEGAGGTHAFMKTDNALAIWFWARGQAPNDIVSREPTLENWGTPTFYLPFGDACSSDNIGALNIVFDISTCGGWATGQFAATCNGTCEDAVKDPSNFIDAHFAINYVDVYNITGP